MRVKFKDGEQRRFLKKVLEESSVPSLRVFMQFGFDVPYSTLKNYYNESRLLSSELFDDLCEVANIDKDSLSFEFVDENWGKVKSGRKSLSGKAH